EVGGALRDALGNPPLTAGARLTGFPASLSYTQTVAAGDGTEVTDPLGHVWSYFADDQGRLVRMLAPADASGARQDMRYDYDADGNVIRITDGNGNAVERSYDANGNLLESRDAAGNTVRYSYGEHNLLLAQSVYRTPDP